MTDCLICDRVTVAQSGENPWLICEMEHTVFVVGDHQFHPGYALVLLKEHVREPFELSPHVQREHFAEVMRAAHAIQQTFQPWKLNFSCYGNSEPHVHWHIFPRYEDDPNRGNPWKEASRFSEKAIHADQAREIADRIRQRFV
jgi:diadenosine tetraphosphate (Ap4A) HIT family hydrolase